VVDRIGAARAADGGEAFVGHGAGGGIGDGEGSSAGGWADRDLPPPPAPAAPPRASVARPCRAPGVPDATSTSTMLTCSWRGSRSTGRRCGRRALIKGVDLARADVAAAQIWRFRYAPALDDSGRPQRVTIDQQFTLGH
jgi:hypothetical protein